MSKACVRYRCLMSMISFLHIHIFSKSISFSGISFLFSFSFTFRNCFVLSSHFIVFYFIFRFCWFAIMPTQRIMARSSGTMTKKQRKWTKQTDGMKMKLGSSRVFESSWKLIISICFCPKWNDLPFSPLLLLTREWKWISINNSTIVRRNNQNKSMMRYETFKTENRFIYHSVRN